MILILSCFSMACTNFLMPYCRNILLCFLQSVLFSTSKYLTGAFGLRFRKILTKLIHADYFVVSSEDEDEYGDDEEWMENVVQKGPRGPIEVFHKTHYNDTNDHYNDTNGWTSKLTEARYNEMIALQKEQEGMDEAKRLSEKEICAKVLGKRSACAFSFKPTTREEELEAENEQLKLELQEMKVTMTSVKDMQKVIN